MKQHTGKSMEEKFKYRDPNYFNESDMYAFDTMYGTLKTKVNFDKGYWWTNKKEGRDQYKCSSVECYNLTSIN